MTYSWSSEDPRYTTDKYRRVVIHIGGDAITGIVETKYGWSINTSHEYKRYQFISADDDWPSHWLWIDAPEKQ